MTSQTKNQQDWAERKAYRALDAIQGLVDDGYGCLATDQAMTAIRRVIDKVRDITVRSREDLRAAAAREVKRNVRLSEICRQTRERCHAQNLSDLFASLDGRLK